MKLFRDLLLENPDTVYYKKKTYNYRSPANKCAFLVYKDEKSGKNTVFGYSLIKKDFLCDDPDVLKDVDELSKQPSIKLDTGSSSYDQLDYWGQRAIDNLKNSNSGGGHLDIENLLKGIGRFGQYADPLLKGRIFEVDDPKTTTDQSNLMIETTIPNDKAIIVSFWTYDLSKLMLYKKQYEYVIEFNGYDPKEVLYEPGSKIYTYNELYAIEEPKKEPAHTTSNTTDTAPWNTQTADNSVKFEVGDTVRLKGFKDVVGKVTHIDGNYVTINITNSKYPLGPLKQGRDIKQLASGIERVQPVDGSKASDYFKVGDKVKVKGMKTSGDVLSVDGNNVTIKITDTDVQGVEVGSQRTFYYGFLEPDTKSISNSLEKVIDDKTQEFVEKRGKLHTTGAAFTPAEKANLEREVDSLEIELKILNDLLNNGIKTYTDNVKSVVATSVQRKLHAKEKEKQDRYSLIAQAEKQYGMPIAQIRQKYRGVPLDQLVKKESLYKKLLKALRG